MEEEGVRYWKAYGIGEGKVKRWSDWGPQNKINTRFIVGSTDNKPHIYNEQTNEQELELRGPNYKQQDQEAYLTMEEVNREAALQIPDIPRGPSRKRKAQSTSRTRRTCPN